MKVIWQKKISQENGTQKLTVIATFTYVKAIIKEKLARRDKESHFTLIKQINTSRIYNYHKHMHI
jgi:hypothetical protein